ncbi:trypsin-like serine protease [Granulosicoccus antarcticus]|uniref:Peptidase S1 domain-containing protein n=1 Tax=Granulosicoccus antarcticus IMCC3135 TaxID=1192854 RepID=A0A2Z2NLD7_9GAMM|nr:trypsin-like serine protease [Granulosicoccus antarcticus]ASJ71973.1 hypothetical protein IMCC3135_09380 [Granulosicoccus antarcticus IMCC3135]
MSSNIHIHPSQKRFFQIRICLQLLASCALYLLITTMSKAGGESSQSSAFHYGLDSQFTTPHCVATKLKSSASRVRSLEQKPDVMSRQVVHALTAAHCFRNTVESINIGCRDSSTVEALITAFYWHPTHDVVLMKLLVNEACLGKGVSLRHQELDKHHQNKQLVIPGTVQPQSMTFGESRAFEPATPSSEFVRVAEILSVDQETLRLSDQVVCLKAGDSGYPLLMNGEIAGMLISGLEGCPTEQIAIRTDRIANWISRHME